MEKGGGLPGDGLSAEESARGVDVEGTSPFVGRHVDGVLAADDAGETAEDIRAAQLRGGFFDRLLDLCRVRDVDSLRHDLCVWKIRPQGLDRCVCVGGIQIEQGEPGETVFE